MLYVTTIIIIMFVTDKGFLLDLLILIFKSDMLNFYFSDFEKKSFVKVSDKGFLLDPLQAKFFFVIVFKSSCLTPQKPQK